MKVLVACEFSGVVRSAFRRRGHDAWSCDLLEAEDGSEFHIRGDVLELLEWSAGYWDVMIAHPSCQYLAVSGARWFKEKRHEQEEALEFVRRLLDSGVRAIALENPISVISSRIRKPDQIIQLWEYGHKEMKSTCWWLKNLPPLKPTNIVGPPPNDKEARKQWEIVHREAPSPNRWKNRSRTRLGVADALAEQWGSGSRVNDE